MLYNKSPEEKVQILDFQLGINQESVLCPAYLNAMGFDGQPYIIDQRASCKKIFPEITDVRGFYVRLGANRVWMEEITFAIDGDGAYFPAAFAGIDASGR